MLKKLEMKNNNTIKPGSFENTKEKPFANNFK